MRPTRTHLHTRLPRAEEPERRRVEEMPEKGWEDLPEHDVAEAPNRFDVDGFRARLFGGPGATLYGDSGIPAQSTWDSKEIPTVGRDGISDSGVRHSGAHSGVYSSGAWGAEEFLGTDQGRGGGHSAAETGSLVRPYTRTGGRTRSDYDLAIEALVSTSERGKAPDAAVLPEHRSICGLCLDTRSVAEVAAHLRLPLGVARVLIGDMAGMGLVLIHQSGMVVGDRPSIEFMERVLSGLRRL
ncbi:uncharacterized protein DUF742 [Actinophytocola oryzae]|uniref:Uncharacterized protein DUF742 n=2 Tax=Actinophytocola oryzae TaxID=502181 RepID=A0A4V3FR13_9PSEU|nr:DUF742 domain-containing protein [Actinophytocola oryzae]TDV41851.1 uncharacterized protein DUF742 [Actinophytocola oryzae]